MKIVPYILLVILGVLSIVSLVAVGWSFRSRNFPVTFPKSLYLSLLVGGLSSIFLFSLIIAFGICLWIQSGMVKSILGVTPLMCLLPIIFSVVFLGSFIQITYVNKLSEVNESLINLAIKEKKGKNLNRKEGM